MKIKGWRDIYQVNITKKKAREIVSYLIKQILTEEDMIRVVPIKDIIGQGDLYIISICPSSNIDSKYFKAIAKQQENRYKSTTIAVGFLKTFLRN